MFTAEVEGVVDVGHAVSTSFHKGGCWIGLATKLSSNDGAKGSVHGLSLFLFFQANLHSWTPINRTWKNEQFSSSKSP